MKYFTVTKQLCCTKAFAITKAVVIKKIRFVCTISCNYRQCENCWNK